ncbi:MAG: serine/threonine protein phosphatase [Proteobacteria bacterium]|nr:serine/threonine protein phosphatase [Pseudomonadota bacterium]
MTRYAIGDIHGGSKTFQALLGRLNLKPGDRLHLLGDYIDRGPDSRGVLDTMMRLMAVGYDVCPVRGNHEDMLLQSVSGTNDYWMEGWGIETLKSFGATSLDELPDVYLNLLDQMPYIRSDENFVFVHAGLDMTVADPPTESTPFAMVWGENSPFGRDRLEGRTLVTGHKIRPLPLIEASLLTNNFQLDNGAFTAMQPNFGNLVAVNLDTMELYIQRWCD